MISREDAYKKAEDIVSVNGINNFRAICIDISLVSKWTLDEVDHALRETVKDAIADLIFESEEDKDEQ